MKSLVIFLVLLVWQKRKEEGRGGDGGVVSSCFYGPFSWKKKKKKKRGGKETSEMKVAKSSVITISAFPEKKIERGKEEKEMEAMTEGLHAAVFGTSFKKGKEKKKTQAAI